MRTNTLLAVLNPAVAKGRAGWRVVRVGLRVLAGLVLLVALLVWLTGCTAGTAGQNAAINGLTAAQQGQLTPAQVAGLEKAWGSAFHFDAEEQAAFNAELENWAAGVPVVPAPSPAAEAKMIQQIGRGAKGEKL